MKLTQEQITKINNECPYDQGVFVQPNGIPVSIKEPVIYTRYETGGYSGGSCWDDSDPQPYTSEIPKDKFKVLDLVLKELCPNISYLQYKEIESLIDYNNYSENEYYGNCSNYQIEFIQTSKLYNLLESWKKV